MGCVTLLRRGGSCWWEAPVPRTGEAVLGWPQALSISSCPSPGVGAQAAAAKAAAKYGEYPVHLAPCCAPWAQTAPVSPPGWLLSPSQAGGGRWCPLPTLTSSFPPPGAGVLPGAGGIPGVGSIPGVGGLVPGVGVVPGAGGEAGLSPGVRMPMSPLPRPTPLTLFCYPGSRRAGGCSGSSEGSSKGRSLR